MLYPGSKPIGAVVYFLCYFFTCKDTTKFQTTKENEEKNEKILSKIQGMAF